MGRIDECLVLTVNDRTMDLQSPENGSITIGGAFDVYAQGYEPALRPSVLEQGDLRQMLLATGWMAASFGSQQGNNDEFVADIGTGLSSIVRTIMSADGNLEQTHMVDTMVVRMFLVN